MHIRAANAATSDLDHGLIRTGGWIINAAQGKLIARTFKYCGSHEQFPLLWFLEHRPQRIPGNIRREVPNGKIRAAAPKILSA
jgi:hypothetical protein